jgi:hypothetical protein
MKLVLATVYTNFNTEVVDDTGIEQVDDMMATPVSGQVILKFKNL